MPSTTELSKQISLLDLQLLSPNSIFGWQFPDIVATQNELAYTYVDWKKEWFAKYLAVFTNNLQQFVSNPDSNTRQAEQAVATYLLIHLTNYPLPVMEENSPNLYDNNLGCDTYTYHVLKDVQSFLNFLAFRNDQRKRRQIWGSAFNKGSMFLAQQALPPLTKVHQFTDHDTPVTEYSTALPGILLRVNNDLIYNHAYQVYIPGEDIVQYVLDVY